MNNLFDNKPYALPEEGFNLKRLLIILMIVFGGLISISSYYYFSTLKPLQEEEIFRIDYRRTTKASEREAILLKYLDINISPVLLLQLANEYYDTAAYSKSIEMYRLFLEKYPKHILKSSAELGLATALEADNQTKPSIKVYEKIISQKPANTYTPVAMLNLGRIYQKQKNIKKARHHLEQCTVLFPQTIFAKEAKNRLKITSQF